MFAKANKYFERRAFVARLQRAVIIITIFTAMLAGLYSLSLSASFSRKKPILSLKMPFLGVEEPFLGV